MQNLSSLHPTATDRTDQKVIIFCGGYVRPASIPDRYINVTNKLHSTESLRSPLSGPETLEIFHFISNAYSPPPADQSFLPSAQYRTGELIRFLNACRSTRIGTVFSPFIFNALPCFRGVKTIQKPYLRARRSNEFGCWQSPGWPLEPLYLRNLRDLAVRRSSDIACKKKLSP